MISSNQKPCRRCLRHTLADAVRNTRLARRLSVQRAARLAGLELRQWLALEAAEWIPDDGPELEAITRVLKGNSLAASFYAMVSRDNQ
jgi:hypothetical protein